MNQSWSWPSLSTAAMAASTSFSYISGPTVGATTYAWTQVYTPHTVGTVFVTVDEAAHTTISSTSYNTQYVDNQTLASSIHVRTDTDAAGTVTAVALNGTQNVTL